MDKTVETGTFTRVTYAMPPAVGVPLMILLLAIVLVPFFRIWSRTGHSGFWSILMLVPLVNIVSLWVLAFKKWPAVDGGRTGLR